ncbi:hypothetical protein B0H17DRAFT_1143587 [Mycena rosella]|uniref:Uncharacterized protein n=1 Tax=Mycena rosella TaxID=1033263 RepID=A0AAD7G7N0_MYCRO|nr:hypothetical protein B0H17DRAFT_1143587 [Mycena rosella]
MARLLLVGSLSHTSPIGAVWSDQKFSATFRHRASRQITPLLKTPPLPIMAPSSSRSGSRAVPTRPRPRSPAPPQSSNKGKARAVDSNEPAEDETSTRPIRDRGRPAASRIVNLLSPTPVPSTNCSRELGSPYPSVLPELATLHEHIAFYQMFPAEMTVNTNFSVDGLAGEVGDFTIRADELARRLAPYPEALRAEIREAMQICAAYQGERLKEHAAAYVKECSNARPEYDTKKKDREERYEAEASVPVSLRQELEQVKYLLEQRKHCLGRARLTADQCAIARRHLLCLLAEVREVDLQRRALGDHLSLGEQYDLVFEMLHQDRPPAGYMFADIQSAVAKSAPVIVPPKVLPPVCSVPAPVQSPGSSLSPKKRKASSDVSGLQSAAGSSVPSATKRRRVMSTGLGNAEYSQLLDAFDGKLRRGLARRHTAQITRGSGCGRCLDHRIPCVEFKVSPLANCAGCKAGKRKCNVNASSRAFHESTAKKTRLANGGEFDASSDEDPDDNEDSAKAEVSVGNAPPITTRLALVSQQQSRLSSPPPAPLQFTSCAMLPPVSSLLPPPLPRVKISSLLPESGPPPPKSSSVVDFDKRFCQLEWRILYILKSAILVLNELYYLARPEVVLQMLRLSNPLHSPENVAQILTMQDPCVPRTSMFPVPIPFCNVDFYARSQYQALGNWTPRLIQWLLDGATRIKDLDAVVRVAEGEGSSSGKRDGQQIEPWDIFRVFPRDEESWDRRALWPLFAPESREGTLTLPGSPMADNVYVRAQASDVSPPSSPEQSRKEARLSAAFNCSISVSDQQSTPGREEDDDPMGGLEYGPD